jgi:fermentation-respiration switch protein FrsA (DUF1100 family)
MIERAPGTIDLVMPKGMLLVQTSESCEAGSLTPAHRRGLRARALLIRALRLLLLILGGSLVVLYLIQDRMIFPGMATQGAPEAKVNPRPGTELLKLITPEGERVVALYGPALLADGRPHPHPESRPALLYFYGNAMCLAYAERELDRFRRLGLNVMIPDFLGFGLSSGKASELGCRQTAQTALEWLRLRGFESSRIIAGGWSLGGAVAVDLAYRQQVGGLIAFSTFTSIRDMALSIIPVPLPGFLFAHKFDSLSKIPSVTCPILLGHGRLDRIAPFPMFERLKKAARAPVWTIILDRAEHNDFYEVGGKQIDEAIEKLVEVLPK